METILRIDGLSKTFGATQALDGASLAIAAGEVHGLVGQNGSGKSTLIKLLSGYHAPDAGRAYVKGTELALPPEPAELRRLGISFMHQELGLVESMSVLENLRLGRYETGRGGRIRWRRERARSRELLSRFELDVEPDAPVKGLSQTERAILGVIRALHEVEQAAGRGLLVLDEPTAALPADEVERLWGALRQVTAAGSSALFVSHSLDEVLAICGMVSVLRDGRLVTTRPTAGLSERELIVLIVGRELGDLYPEARHQRAGAVLAVRGLTGRVARNVSLTLHEGESLGLTGLAGAGHDELLYLIYGAQAPLAGALELDGSTWTSPSPQQSKRAGLALLPADRQRLSGVMRATVRENVTLPSLSDYARGGRLDRRSERTAVEDVLGRFGVRPPDPERRLHTLSGGNQQKALLAKWMRLDPRVLLLHEPTHGVDVEARKGIFELLRDGALRGTSVLYSSVEYEDLANLCDRVLVFRRGRVVAELAGDALTADRILEQCYQAAA